MAVTQRPRKSCGRVLLVFAAVTLLLVFAGWWLLVDHKPGIAPDKARQALDGTVVGTFGSISPPVATAFDGYGSEPRYSSFHLAATQTGRATFTRDQEVMTIIAPAEAEKFRDELKDYWKANGYSAVHETFLHAQIGRTREWTVTSSTGVSIRLDMDEFSPYHISMLAYIGEVMHYGSGDPYPTSPPTDPSPFQQSGSWSSIHDPYWSQ